MIPVLKKIILKSAKRTITFYLKIKNERGVFPVDNSAFVYHK
jgi:hypothetical protein